MNGISDSEKIDTKIDVGSGFENKVPRLIKATKKRRSVQILCLYILSFKVIFHDISTLHTSLT